MRRQGLWTRHALFRQLVLAGLVVLAGLALTIDRNNLFEKWKWIHKENTQFWISAVVAILIFVNTVGELIAQRRALRGEARRVDLHQAVITALVAVSIDTGKVVTDFGANVFLVRRGRRWHRSVTLSGRVFQVGRPPRLERIERVRLSEYPAQSNLTWTPGKGVIGRCWANKRPEYVNWSPLAKKWHGKEITETAWESITAAERGGFSRQEFMQMVGKYAEIRAVPIKDPRGNIIGVLAVDRRWRSDQGVAKLLHTTTVEETATTAASVLYGVLGGK